MDIVKLYNDTSTTGESLLYPFKQSVEILGRSYSHWNNQNTNFGEKILDVLKRITFFVAGLLGILLTSTLLPAGLAVKYFMTRDVQQIPRRPRDPNNQPPNTPPLPPAGTASDDPLKSEIDPAIHKDEFGVHITNVRNYPGDLEYSYECKPANGPYDSLEIHMHPSIKVEIRNQDLFESGADVIVNAANTHLGGGGGIDGAIHSKGGQEYAQLHKGLQTKYSGSFQEGYASMIDSGKLHEKFGIQNVIVVAGPQGDSTPQKEDHLYSCYFNALLLAHQLGNKHIAFPSISTGTFGFPKNRAAQISLRAIHDFLAMNPIDGLEKISIHFFVGGIPEYIKAATGGPKI